MKACGKGRAHHRRASGMGQSEAIIFAREGAKVVVADVLEFEARQVREDRRGRRPGAVVKLDVTSEADWENAVKATVTAFGKLDLLVNQRGDQRHVRSGHAEHVSLGHLMNVNAKGRVPRHEARGARHARRRRRLHRHISSISGFVGQDRITWATTRRRVRAIMTKSGAVQFAQHGIRVNSVHPGILPPMRTSKASVRLPG